MMVRHVEIGLIIVKSTVSEIVKFNLDILKNRRLLEQPPVQKCFMCRSMFIPKLIGGYLLFCKEKRGKVRTFHLHNCCTENILYQQKRSYNGYNPINI